MGPSGLGAIRKAIVTLPPESDVEYPALEFVAAELGLPCQVLEDGEVIPATGADVERAAAAILRRTRGSIG